MKFRSERSRQFLRNQALFDSTPEEDFGSDPVAEDFSVPETFNTYAAQQDATAMVAVLLKQIQDGRFVVGEFDATTVTNNKIAYNTNGRGSTVQGRPEINITMTLLPGPNNDPTDDEYPDTAKPPDQRAPAGSDPVRLLILEDFDD